ILLMPYAWRRNGGKVHGKDRDKGKDIHMLVSAHRDGQLIAKTIGHLGIRSVEGSSSKGGAAALKRMVGILKSGDYVGITPDGPRGPRMRASGGVVALARLSGVPIIPVTCSVTRFRMLKSWDRFIITWPFCRGVFAWGEPIEVPRDADDHAQEEYRQKIETALNDLCLEVDGMTGLPTVVPAPIEFVKAVTMVGSRDSGEGP
ncbi:MAG: lysophospholipid acyltransferase family protein, partial [Rhodospirillales bacterium]|nr:lysophospholipid acyltransferase family protein [Rhodospirillales bacterium]